jgi:hypothetical protein
VCAEPVATCGGDAPDDGGPTASIRHPASPFYVAGLLVLAQSPVVGGQQSLALARFGQEAGQRRGRQWFRILRQCFEEPGRAGFCCCCVFHSGDGDGLAVTHRLSRAALASLPRQVTALLSLDSRHITPGRGRISGSQLR